MGDWISRLLLVMLIILSTIPTGLDHLATCYPMIGSTIVFFFYLHAPRVLNYATMIILFLIQDILYGLPVGLSLCGYAVLYAALMRTAHYLSSYELEHLWKYFAAYSTIPMLVIGL